MVGGRLTACWVVSLPSTITSFSFLSDGSIVIQHGIQTMFKGLASLLKTYDEIVNVRKGRWWVLFITADTIRNNMNMREEVIWTEAIIR